MSAAVRSPGFRARQECRHAASHGVGVGSCSGDAADREEPRDDARDVGVERPARARRTRGTPRPRTCSSPNPGSVAQDRRVAREPARHASRTIASRGSVQVPGAGVVAEARPGREHARFPRPGERRQVRKTSEERVVARGDRGHGRLLEHDLRDPDPVRIAGSAPGKPSLFSRRNQASSAARIAGCDVAACGVTRSRRRQEAVTSVRGAIQFGSRMRFRMNVFSSSFGQDLGDVLLVRLRFELFAGHRIGLPGELADASGGTSCRARRAVRPRPEGTC